MATVRLGDGQAPVTLAVAVRVLGRQAPGCPRGPTRLSVRVALTARALQSVEALVQPSQGCRRPNSARIRFPQEKGISLRSWMGSELSGEHAGPNRVMGAGPRKGAGGWPAALQTRCQAHQRWLDGIGLPPLIEAHELVASEPRGREGCLL